MSRLTEDLLNLARIESREHRFEFSAVQPEALLQDAEQSFREIARASGVELCVENCTGQVPAELVKADQHAVHQVFANLIDNAIKYGGGGGRVVIGTRLAPGDSGKLEFFVRDYGAGIPSQHLSRLFERFYRVDKMRSRESGGTGLGLAIAKHIVLAHGGEIQVTSELNHGSTFVFTLPVESEAVSQ
jgi:two-component system phosphate regulon sensor histidine kinase PhoR